MELFHEVPLCRLCQGSLKTVIHFGDQCLAGQFPLPGEEDPPRVPLDLTCCEGRCGLVQLRHNVDLERMFKNYWYRSGVTQTMRAHLEELAESGMAALGRVPEMVLDIGGNDGTMLLHLAGRAPTLVSLDPSDVEMSEEARSKITRLQDFYPSGKLKGSKFDLIFSVACFYDAQNPVSFARAVRENLKEGGVWVCEVASLDKLLEGAWDSICHEHVTYWDATTFNHLCHMAGLTIFRVETNNCNGGSLRFYVHRNERDDMKRIGYGLASQRDGKKFREKVISSKEHLVAYLRGVCKGERVHLLGASTKMNTVLQYCGLDASVIEAASDRDPRKWGRRTPGSGIPIISEEESRARKPDVYLVGPYHFKKEIIEREKEFVEAGGKLVFPLPCFSEVERPYEV